MKSRLGDNTDFYRKLAVSKVSFLDIFSEVFKHHSKQDGERLMMAGNLNTASNLNEILIQWKKPWLFTRVLAFGMAIIFLLEFLMMEGYGTYAVIPLYFIGAFIVPLSAVILYFELNIPRNIPIYEVMIMILAGGVLSIIFTACFNRFTGPKPAYLAPLTEEPAKLLALCLFLRKPDRRYILNGILIGGAVGAGFAAIETTGYGFNNLVIRGLLSIGCHVLWAAIYGGALAKVLKNETFSLGHLVNKEFLKYFLECCLLHFIWNSNIFIEFGNLKYIVLIIAGWLIFLEVINGGMKQIVSLCWYKEPAFNRGTYSLYGVRGAYEKKILPLSGGKVIMGRDASKCNIMFPAYIPGISRCHCTIMVENNKVYLCDNGSTYGTYLENNVKLQPGVKTQLKPGQRFYLGSIETMFELRL